MIVMEGRTETNVRVWAWCTVGEGAGFESVVYTQEDGYTPATPTGRVRLEKFLFQT